jgi:hypothetical protein
MKLFDFLKPKKSELNDSIAHLHASIFPKGEKDMNAVTNELLLILNNKISISEATNIALKAIAISRISQNFNRERLKSHLAGYCLHYFSDKQIDKFYNYLAALSTAWTHHNRTPSEVKREGDDYLW